MLNLGIQRSLYLCELFMSLLRYFSWVLCYKLYDHSLPFLEWFRFGPRESKKAMMYSEVGRINCNVSFTTFSSRRRDQVLNPLYFSELIFICHVCLT